MSAAFTHTAPGPLPISPFLHGKQSHTCLAASFSILKSGASDMVGGCCCWEDTQLKTKTKTRECCCEALQNTSNGNQTPTFLNRKVRRWACVVCNVTNQLSFGSGSRKRKGRNIGATKHNTLHQQLQKHSSSNQVPLVAVVLLKRGRDGVHPVVCSGNVPASGCLWHHCHWASNRGE